MMRFIWNRINKQTLSIDSKRRLFLLCNVFAFCFVGLVLWCAVGAWTLKGMDWMLCFIGYPGVFVGYFGGILYMWKQDS